MPKENPQTDMFDELGVEKEWEKEWKGMPEFKRADERPYQKIVVNFRNKEDVELFGGLINQKLYPTTDSIWFPPFKTPTGVFIDGDKP